MANSNADSPSVTVSSESGSPSRWRRLFTFSVALLVAVVLVIGGRWLIGERAAAVDGPAPQPPIAVTMTPVVESSGYVRHSRHVGLVEPRRQTALAFETGGTVVDVLVEEGDKVREGQVVAQLDTRTLEAERRAHIAARAALSSDLERAQLALERQQALEARNFTAEQSFDDARLLVARSEALIIQSDAAIAAIDVSLDKATLRAPFNAEVGSQTIDEGSTVSAGTPVAVLLEDSKPMVRLGVPANQNEAFVEGSSHTIDIDKIAYSATVASTRSDLSARTRTLDVLLRLDVSGTKPAPAFGQTAELVLQQYYQQPGYSIPLSALSEGEEGLWSVFVKQPDEPGSDTGTVVREHVDILHTDGVTAFVQGPLSGNAQIINNGPHRIVVGQRVRNVADSQ